MIKFNWKDRVMAMFWGIPIGDGLGLPVETMKPKEIIELFGKITFYVRNLGHKWYGRFEAGQTSDDSQLSFANTESIISYRGIYSKDIARRHVKAKNKCSIGWGRSTLESTQKIEDGVPWQEAGKLNGSGNGVSMKMAPVGAYMFAYALGLSRRKSLYFSEYGEAARKKVFPKIAELAIMTHKSSMAIASGLAQADAIFTCLMPDIERNFEEQFLENVLDSCWMGEGLNVGDTITDKLSVRIEKDLIRDKVHKKMSVRELAEYFGGASCYVYNSLPFCYAAFLKNPRSIETLYDVVNAGGDTDTNGSIVGALLGAYNGTKIFPKHLVNGMWQKDYVLDLAERFCKKFGIEND